MARTTPGARLRAFRESLKLTLRAASAQLNVTHPALRQWEANEVVPSEPFRDAIEKWSNGLLPSSMWGLTPREARIAGQLADVKPATMPPDEVLERPSKTGTDE